MAPNVNNNLRSFGIATDLLTHKENIIKTRFIDENSGYQLMRMDEDKEVSPITAHNLDHHLSTLADLMSWSFLTMVKVFYLKIG